MLTTYPCVLCVHPKAPASGIEQQNDVANRVRNALNKMNKCDKDRKQTALNLHACKKEKLDVDQKLEALKKELAESQKKNTDFEEQLHKQSHEAEALKQQLQLEKDHNQSKDTFLEQKEAAHGQLQTAYDALVIQMNDTLSSQKEISHAENITLQNSISQLQKEKKEAEAIAEGWKNTYDAYFANTLVEVQSYTDHYHKYEKEKAELAQENASLIAQLQQNHDTTDLAIQNIVKQIDDQQIATVQHLQEAHAQQLAQLKAAMHTQEEKVETLTATVEQLKLEKSKLVQDELTAKSAATTLGTKFTMLSENIAQEKEAHKSTQNNLLGQIEILTKTIKMHEQTVVTQQEKMSALLQSLNAHDTEKHKWEQKSLELGNEVAQWKQKHATVDDKNKELNKHLVNLESSNATQKYNQQSLVTQLSKLQTENEKHEQIASDAQNRIFDLESRLILSKKEPEVPPLLHPSEEEWISMFLQRPIAQEFVPIGSLSTPINPMSSPFAPLRRQPETTYWHHIH